MYLLFRSATVDGTPNQLLSGRLFGVPLGAHWLSGAGVLSVPGAVFIAVFAILAALCWLSIRLAARATVPAAVGTADAGQKRPDPREPGQAIAGSKAAGVLTRVLPYLTVVIAVFAPLAAAIYLVTTVAWTLAERRLFLARTARAASGPVPESRRTRR
jgi:YidC/Oxa1 family membrane protein insertase